MNEIDNYMTPAEAADRWGIAQTTVRNKMRPSSTPQEEIDGFIKDGLIKYFQKPEGQRKEWIVSVKAMELWFGEIDKK